MALVQVTGSAWDHMRVELPASQHPRLWFRPKGSSVGNAGLMTDGSILANLNLGTGAFTVDLESDPGVQYQPWMDYLIPGQENEPPGDRARGYVEWEFWFYAGNGGPIQDLVDLVPVGMIVAADEPPPETGSSGWIDMSDETEDGAMLWAPEGTV